MSHLVCGNLINGKFVCEYAPKKHNINSYYMGLLYHVPYLSCRDDLCQNTHGTWYSYNKWPQTEGQQGPTDQFCLFSPWWINLVSPVRVHWRGSAVAVVMVVFVLWLRVMVIVWLVLTDTTTQSEMSNFHGNNCLCCRVFFMTFSTGWRWYHLIWVSYPFWISTSGHVL